MSTMPGKMPKMPKKKRGGKQKDLRNWEKMSPAMRRWLKNQSTDGKQ